MVCASPRGRILPPTLRETVTLISLSAQSSCACVDGQREFFDSRRPTVKRNCIVYGMLGAFSTQIELQPCPRCPPVHRRYIGPDPRDIGLFNYNNSTIFTHELLNEYISAFTSSETPFEPWVQTISRRYDELPGGISFIGGGLFRSVWFAHVRLIRFESDKTCPSCGDNPDNVIWDGVSISFGRKHVSSELQPPTVIHKDAPERSSRPVSKPEWLQDIKMRRLIRDWLSSGGLIPEQGENSGGYQAALEDCLQRAKILQLELYPWLHNQSPSLKTLFARRLGHGALQADSKKWKPRREYLTLFQILTADEYSTQAMTRPVLRNLNLFLASPTANNLQGLRGFPALYTILQLEIAREGCFAEETLGVGQWLHDRTQDVLNKLIASNPTPLDQNPAFSLPMCGEFREWEKGVATVFLRYATALGILGCLTM
ncbi:hypothetical protein D9757_003382 [Collybiopsis confluens]|uniref:HMG domain-containing protein n=1 Tax=Collybiopsis confluens TaxID=2823264 RepID=A0A8H5HTZ3_9AGAR|nr:hypothetical protein D9757_003382 [Collybiopsis confluens]